MRAKGILDVIGVHALMDALSSDPSPERTVKSYTMVQEIRDYIDTQIKPRHPEVEEIAPVQMQGGPSGGKPIGFYLVGDDLNKIGEYMAQIMPELKQVK